MSKIEKAFSNGKAFISFLTAGDPSLDKTEEYIIEMAKAGSDLIEIGIPFSDPIAEGKVIEDANIRALNAGTTIDKIFDMIKRVRLKIHVPLVFVTYINPVFVYGVDKFLSACKNCGIDGLIIPDLPFEEQDEILNTCKIYDVDLITLIAPTSKNRIHMLAKNSTGFIYLMGVTDITTDLMPLIQQIKQVSSTPITVGFDISTAEQARVVAKIADGVIVDAAVVKIIEQHGENASPYLYEYISNMKNAVK